MEINFLKRSWKLQWFSFKRHFATHADRVIVREACFAKSQIVSKTLFELTNTFAIIWIWWVDIQTSQWHLFKGFWSECSSVFSRIGQKDDSFWCLVCLRGEFFENLQNSCNHLGLVLRIQEGPKITSGEKYVRTTNRKQLSVEIWEE